MAKKVAKSAKKNTATVSAEKFCQEWAKAAANEKTLDDLAKTLGMEKSAVQARKSNYASSLGLKFPKLARGSKGPRLDKAALQKLLNGHPL
jgi:hypothetical protein